MLEHLVDEKLSLAVRIARVDDDIRLANELADRSELRAGALLLLDEHLPGLRKDREILKAPDFRAFLRFRKIVGEVCVGLGLFQKMAEAPGDDGAVPAFDGGFASAEHAEPLGNGARKGGLFSNVKNGAHGMTLKWRQA